MPVLSALLSAMSDAALLAAAGGLTYTATLLITTIVALAAPTPERRQDARATLALLTQPTTRRSE